MNTLRALAALVTLLPVAVLADVRIEAREIRSEHFEDNKAGVSPVRRLQVMLPASYDTGTKRYPVVYFLHTFFEDERTFFERHRGHERFVDAMASGALDDVILVTADFNTPTGGSLYTNSSVTGQWRDFAIEELVPFIDANYRTLANRSSRAVFGYQVGGYGAIRFASRHPDVFGLVYALHPVATGFGHTLMQSRPNWETLAEAESVDDLYGDGLSLIFTAIYQANLPNPEKPPLYFDPPAAQVDGELVLDAGLTDRLQKSFFLERQVGEFADNMKQLIAFKFDWGRHDGNQDHVYSNQFYSRKLNEYGVAHEAEEYNGGWGDKTFDRGGRIETDVIPFLRQHLIFKEGDE